VQNTHVSRTGAQLQPARAILNHTFISSSH
jgi:hypothetical protein